MVSPYKLCTILLRKQRCGKQGTGGAQTIAYDGSVNEEPQLQYQVPICEVDQELRFHLWWEPRCERCRRRNAIGGGLCQALLTFALSSTE